MPLKLNSHQLALNITATIIALRDDYLARGEAPSFYEINNGLCESFAVDVLDLLGHPKGILDLQNESFMCGDDGDPVGAEQWDARLLETQWGVTPPAGLSWDDLNGCDFGHHVWLSYNGRHYDAECPEGVASPFELPIFARVIAEECAPRPVPGQRTLPTADDGPSP